MKPISWIYRYCRKYVWAIALLALTGMLSAGGFVLLALVSSGLLDVVTGAREGSSLWHCILLAGLVILQGGWNILYSNLRMYVLGKTEIAMRQGMLETIFKKEYAEISHIHSGELLNLFTSDIDVITQGVVGIIPQLASMATRLLSGLWVLFLLDAGFAWGVLGIGTALCLCSRIYSRHFQHLHREVQETGGKVRSFMQECVENLLVVKSFSNEDMMKEKLGERQQIHYKKKVKRNAAGNAANTAAYMLFTGGYYAALAWGAFQIADGALTFGGLTAFLQILNQLRMPFRNMSGLIPRYYSMLSSAQRILDLENLPDESVQTEIKEPKQLYQEMKSIEFSDVGFSYDNKKVLEHFSFSVRKGDMVLVMGTSGRGKSTLIKLLLGLYPCKEGEIFFDTFRGRIKAGAETRRLFAYVPQGNLVLSGSIRENIAFSQKGISEEEIIEAAKTACIWDYIRELPNGLDTVLKERGAGLSEGQIQRIAIARAVCSKAPVLLLDECTSALDKETELAVLNNLKALNTRTIFFISHKNAGLQCCNRKIQMY